MSHHLDSPLARQDVRLDITDLYVFRGESGTVFVVDVCTSTAGNIPVPGWHPEGVYEFKIDLDGDSVEDLTYRFTFDDRDSAGKQRFELRTITGVPTGVPTGAPAGGPTQGSTGGPVRDLGTVLARGTTGEALMTPTGVRTWAGKAADPFWIDLDLVHAVAHALADGTKVDLNGWDPARAKNSFAGHTVYSIVLEVPDDQLLSKGSTNRRIGVWALSMLATDDGGWRVINRCGLPMIQALLGFYNEDLANRLNLGRPSDDLKTFGATVANAIAGVVAAHGTAEEPRAYGESVARRILPNILPYTVGTPAAFGFVEWNGRSLTDNAPDVAFSIAANTPIRIGIGRESVTAKPAKAFPYVAVLSERAAQPESHPTP
jgi:hypothetical protein